MNKLNEYITQINATENYYFFSFVIYISARHYFYNYSEYLTPQNISNRILTEWEYFAFQMRIKHEISHLNLIPTNQNQVLKLQVVLRTLFSPRIR